MDAGDDSDYSVSSYRMTKERFRALVEWERWLEKPLQWLGVLWLGLVVADLLGPPNRTIELIAAGVWVLFVLDFLLRFTLAPRKIRYLKDNVITAVSLVIPTLRVFRVTAAFRTLRVARSLRLARMVGSVNRLMLALQRMTRNSGFRYVALLTIAVILIGAAGIYTFEKDAGGRDGITDFATALWWTSMIMTTMGTDYWPKTTEGRTLTILLALYAFAVFGYMTGTIATFLLGRNDENERSIDRSNRQLAQLSREVAALRTSIEKQSMTKPTD